MWLFITHGSPTLEYSWDNYLLLLLLLLLLLILVITATLPNVGNYIRVVLKRERLSDEAESVRKLYDSILSSLEQGLHLGGRPVSSIVYDDDSGYYSANRIRGIRIF